jgi:PAS domain S-box-containing protein
LDESLSIKSFYPQLKERLRELEESRAYQEQKSAALVNLLEDVQEERRRSRESEARLQAIFDNLPFAFWSTDSDGIVRLANETARRRYGMEIGARISAKGAATVSARYAEEDFLGALAGVVERAERPVSDGDQIRWVQSIAAPIAVDGEVTGVLGVDVDVTRLKRAESALERLNEELESKVEERTERLERTIAELKEAQDRLVMSEKLAAFGRLTAGIAHELNSPLGALESSSSTLSENAATTFASLRSIFRDIGAEAGDALLELLALAASRAADLDYVVDRKKRRKIMKNLEASGIDHAASLADIIDECGTAEAFGPLSERFGVDLAVRLVKAAVGASTIIRSSAIVRNAAERAAVVVRALKNFEGIDQNLAGEGPIEVVDVDVEIAATLELYRSRMRTGVKTLVSLESGAAVRANRIALSQVWVNIITNALQAMAYSGTLEVSTRRKQDTVVAEIVDSGPGISETDGDRVFEPFFTTKVLGEGTGFGLVIAKRVVVRYGGTIEFESRPGRTCFRVTLPVAEDGVNAPASS